jgi:hypothetical protein
VSYAENKKNEKIEQYMLRRILILTTQMETKDNSAFSINGFFNNLPIRIIGTPEEPFFYADDIAAMLGGSGALWKSLKKFGESEIVTPAIRKERGIITYRELCGCFTIDQSMILLTELGAYRLIMVSRSDKAEKFKKYLLALMKNARLAETSKLNTISSIDALQGKAIVLKNKLEGRRRHYPNIFVFKTIKYDNLEDYPLPLADLDKYMIDDFDPTQSILFKYTCRPSVVGHTMYTLYAKIYGNCTDLIYRLRTKTVLDDPEVLHHTWYLTEELPIENEIIIYQ